MLKRRDVMKGAAGGALLWAARVDAAAIDAKHRDAWRQDFYDVSAASVAGRWRCECADLGRLPHGSPPGGPCCECGGSGFRPAETWDSPGASPVMCAFMARDLTSEVAGLLARIDGLGVPGGLSARARAFTCDLRERVGPELVKLHDGLLELGEELDAAFDQADEGG